MTTRASPTSSPACAWCRCPREPTLLRGVTLDVCPKCDRVTVSRTGLESLLGRSVPGEPLVYQDEPALGDLLASDAHAHTESTDVFTSPVGTLGHQKLYLIAGLSMLFGVISLTVTALVLFTSDSTQPEASPPVVIPASVPEPTPMDFASHCPTW